MGRILLILALAAQLASCGGSTRPTAHKGRIINLTDSIFNTGGADTIRFGRLHSGEIAVLQLSLTNQTTQPIAVIDYERSCGCTIFEFDTRPITPQGAQQVTLTFDSRGSWGWQLKTLDIRFAGKRHPLRLFIEAEVE